MTKTEVGLSPDFLETKLGNGGAGSQEQLEFYLIQEDRDRT